MALLHLKPCASHKDGWGPALSTDGELTVPFALFSKSDRIGRPADFLSTQQSSHDGRRDRYGASYGGASTTALAFNKQEDETSFSLVDTKPKPKSRFGIQRIGGNRPRGGRGGRGGSWGGGRGGAWGGGRGGYHGSGAQDGRSGGASGAGQGGQSGAPQQQQQRKKQKGRWEPRRRFGPRDWDRAPKVNPPSITVQPEWSEVAQLSIAQLESATLAFLEKTSGGKRMRGRADDSSEDEESRMRRESQSVQTLYESGGLRLYDKVVDRITTRAPAKLRGSTARFTGIRPDEDVFMKRLTADKAGDYYATDTVLSLLMAAPRSVNSWDIVVRKTPEGVFLDRRPSSLIGFQTVNETGQDLVEEEPPADSINHATQLMHEATGVQRDFIAQVVKDEIALTFPDARPATVTGVPPSAYRYRRFQLGDNKRVVVRSEIQAAVEKKSSDTDRDMLLLAVRSVLEFDAKTGTGVADWRQKLDVQRGYIIATEFRNNACKMTRWIGQTLLSGVDEVRMGFVSRIAPADPKQHTILGVQRFKPLEFAHQVGVKPTYLWGSLHMFLATIESLDCGTYVILRDPNEPTVRFYSVPEGTPLE